jgi:NADH-quinone oxidoreductase subunit L
MLTPLLGKVSRRLRDGLAVASVGLGALFSFSMFPDILTGKVIDWRIPWAHPEVGVLIDPLSVLTVSVVNGIGLLVTVLSLNYLQRDPGLTRYWFILQLFIGVLGLVMVADNLLLLFIGWELVGVCGTALVAFWHQDPEKAHASLKNLMVLRVGDILLMTAIIGIYVYAGTLNILELQQSRTWAGALSRSGLLLPSAVMLLGGPIAKSAQFPLHVRLPDAFPASPAPSNAIIDVSAGTYLIARVLPMFHSVLTDGHGELIVFFAAIAVIGAISTLLGAFMAMVQRSLIKILAYAVMSQLAFMWIGLGVGGLMTDPMGGYMAGILHMVMDAIASGALFLTVAPILYVTGSDDVFTLSGLKKKMPLAFVCMVIGVLALIGVPPFNGFWSGEAIFKATLELAREASDHGRYTLALFSNGLYLVLLAMSALTAFYGVRILGLAFGQKRNAIAIEETRTAKTPATMRIPMTVAAIATVVTGLLAPYIIAGAPSFFSPLLPTQTHIDAFEVVRSWLFEPSILIFYAVLAVGAIPAYHLYQAPRLDFIELPMDRSFLGSVHRFLWHRCYLNALYYRIPSSVIGVSQRMNDHLEGGMRAAMRRTASPVLGLSRGMYCHLEGGMKTTMRRTASSVLGVSRGMYRQVEHGLKATEHFLANQIVLLAGTLYGFLEIRRISKPRTLSFFAVAYLGKPFNVEEIRRRVLDFSQETYLVTIMFFSVAFLTIVILFLVFPSLFGGF